MNPESEAYARHKEKARERQVTLSRSGRDIGFIPPVDNPTQRNACVANFRLFCETYFRATFTLPWSADHPKVIERMEQAVLRGGLFAIAMPRGSGKTSLCECACIWALLYGHRRYVALIGPDAGLAETMLDSIKAEIELNDELAADFPEVCVPIRALEGISKRTAGQLLNGERTLIEWVAGKAVLPTIPGSPSSGSILTVAGITGRIRGLKHKAGDGRSIRPDLVIIDDCQTDESANSAAQCATRERIISGAVLGLAGPGCKIAGVMPCTVIRPGDVADRVLNRTIHPEWQGERCKLAYSLPTNTKLWERYAEIRAESLRAGADLAEATAFYVEHRAAMDDGASVAWPERFNPDEASAVQNAMNLKLQDEGAFWAEYQNEPIPLAAETAELTPSSICDRINRVKRRIVPASLQTLTAFIDVQQDLLYWVVAAWGEGFAGAVVDYGTFPDQHRAYFTLREANPTLATATGIASLEGSVYAGLEKLGDTLLGSEWNIEGGATGRVERCLVDVGWAMAADAVFRFCGRSQYAALLVPSRGKGISAAGNPMSDWPRKPGEKRGLNWLLPAPRPGQVRTLLYDSNFWKSFVHARLAVPTGERGALTLFGDKPTAHRLLADHLTAETKVRTTGRGRELDEWRLKAHKPDNHWFDGLTGCAVAAAMCGVAAEDDAEPKRKATRVSWKEMQRSARDARRNQNRD